MIPFTILQVADESDRAFLEAAYLAHEQLMYAVAMRVLRNPQDAQDAVSQAVVNLIEHVDTLRQIDSNKLKPYIVSTVRNSAINLLHRLQREAPAAQETFAMLEDPAPQPEEETLQAISLEEMRRRMRRLPATMAQVLMLYELDGLDERAIARAMGLQPVSVRVYLSRARQKLRESLQDAMRRERQQEIQQEMGGGAHA